MIERGRRQSGFTLLELLVALAIFGLVSAMAYGGLQAVLETRSRVQEEGERLGAIQLALNVMARDLTQAVDRPWRDSWGEPQPPLQYDRLASPPRLTLVHAGGRVGEGRSRLRRVAYELEDGVLHRLLWARLDGGAEEPVVRGRLLGGEEGGERVAELVYRFHYRDPGAAPGDEADGIGETDVWPPERGEGDERLLAVEVVITLDNGGTIQRIFPYQGGRSMTAAAPRED